MVRQFSPFSYFPVLSKNLFFTTGCMIFFALRRMLLPFVKMGVFLSDPNTHFKSMHYSSICYSPRTEGIQYIIENFTH